MKRPPQANLRLDFSAFPSIAILQAERLERRIKDESGKRKAGTPTEVFDRNGLMKEMHSEGVIDKDDLLKVEAIFAEQYKPIWRYKDFEL